MKINNDKTKVINFRNKSTKITDVTFQHFNLVNMRLRR